MAVPAPESPDDEALLQAVRRGDERALSALLERHAPSVLRFGMRMCRDPDDAQDVVQETLLAAARGLRDFRGDSRLSTWLYKVARSACIKKRRTSKFAPTSVESIGDVNEADVVSTGHLPDEVAGRRELVTALESAIGALDPASREVLVLRDVEGLTADEVAEVVGASVVAVKSRLHRARVAVRDRLRPWIAPDAGPSVRGDAGCPDIETLFSRYLEDEISREDCDAMQRHVDSCAACHATCDALRETVRWCRSRGTDAVPADVQERLRASIRAALEAAAAARGV